jgi:hypothetical protein
MKIILEVVLWALAGFFLLDHSNRLYGGGVITSKFLPVFSFKILQRNFFKVCVNLFQLFVDIT